MAPPIPVAVINGFRYSWPSIEFKLKGQIYRGITEINYKHKLDIADVYGTDQAPIGDTAGIYKADPVTVSMYRSEAEALREALWQASGRKGYGMFRFLGLVTAAEKGAPTLMDQLVGMRLADEDMANKQGPDASMEKLGFYVRFIRRNGKTLFRESGVR